MKSLDAQPAMAEHERPLTDTIRVGDIVRWGGLPVKVTDMTANEGSVQVVLERLDRGDALPISVPVNDLDGAEVWCFAGTYNASMPDMTPAVV